MSPDSEEIQHESVDREKPLRVRSGFEPAHLSLALSRRLMRHLCAVVRVSVRAMGDGRHDRSVRSPVAAQLVGDQPPRLMLLALQQLAEKTLGSPRAYAVVRRTALLHEYPLRVGWRGPPFSSP